MPFWSSSPPLWGQEVELGQILMRWSGWRAEGNAYSSTDSFYGTSCYRTVSNASPGMRRSLGALKEG